MNLKDVCAGGGSSPVEEDSAPAEGKKPLQKRRLQNKFHIVGNLSYTLLSIVYERVL